MSGRIYLIPYRVSSVSMLLCHLFQSILLRLVTFTYVLTLYLVLHNLDLRRSRSRASPPNAPSMIICLISS